MHITLNSIKIHLFDTRKDISKIWFNSYQYNEKNSRIYKLTIEMEKYYKKLMENPSKKPVKV